MATDTEVSIANAVNTILGGGEPRSDKDKALDYLVMGTLGPAGSIFKSVLDAMGIFDGGGLKATPMTPEEAARFDIDQAIDQFELQQMFGSPDAEGAGDAELINELVDRVDRTPDLSDRDFAEVLSILKAYPAAQDYDYSKDIPDETDSGGGGSSASSGLPSDPAQVAADNAAQTAADTAADIIGDTSPSAGGAGSDAMNVFVYDASDNVFVSASGERFPAGDVSDVPIADGGKYSVRPDLNSTGDVIAEHVVDVSGNKVATVGEPDPNTGIPNLINVIGQLGAFDLPTDAPVIGPTQTTPADSTGGGPIGPAGGGPAGGGPTGTDATNTGGTGTGTGPGTGVGTGPGTGSGSGEGDGDGDGDGTQQLADIVYGGGIGVSTEQAGVAEITNMFDPTLSLAENMARMLNNTKKQGA